MTLTFDLLTLKVVSESRLTWATSVLIFSHPRLLCSRLRPDVRDGQTDVRQYYRLMPRLGAGHNKFQVYLIPGTSFRGFIRKKILYTEFQYTFNFRIAVVPGFRLPEAF